MLVLASARPNFVFAVLALQSLLARLSLPCVSKVHTPACSYIPIAGATLALIPSRTVTKTS
eukprot:5642689-Pleurochrysis_carterae.AAC.4